MAYTLAQLQAMGAKPNVAPQKSYTLAELQKMGAKPVAAAAPALPAPKPKAPVADLIPHFKYKQEDSTKPVKVVGKAILNIPHEAATHLTNIAKVPVEGYKTFADPNVQANKGAAALGAAQGAYEAVGKPIVGALTTLGRTIQGGVQQGVKTTTGFDIGDKAAEEAWNNKLPNTIAAVEGFQRSLVENPVATAFGTAEGVRVARGLPRGTDPISSMARPTIDTVKKAASPITKPIAAARQTKLIQKTAGEIAAVESNYAKGRKAAKYSKDAGAASRERVAKSAVLKDAVDADGKILTSQPGGAIEQYRKTYVAPKESVVRDLLVKEGGKALASEVEAYLLETVRKSNLTGKELTTALKNVKREMAGYKLKADAEGRIPLEVLHDAKINTTPKGNKFLTPPEVQAYNKTLGRGLKELVEKYSKEDIKGINSELAKYYEDLALLERLDGARVRGGKLGKYTSQITGNIAGGIAGSAFGPFGSAVGTVVGGEVSSAMKGAAMGRTFGGVTERVPMRSAILEKAAADAKAPRLALPEATSEFRSQIGSGPTIQLPAGEAPTSRVLPSKSGKGSETQLSPQSVTLPKNTTIPKELQPLAAEAKKYKSAEEFVKGQEPIYKGFKGDAALGSFSTDVNHAQGWANRTKGQVVERYFKSDTKFAPYQEYHKKFAELKTEKATDSYFKSKGYDGVDFRKSPTMKGVSEKEIRIWNPEKLLTKSQLTDLWNKVNPQAGIPKELAPLAKEAAKYKSAEEFVKGFEKRSFNPFGVDDTRIPKADVELHNAFMEYAQKPEIQKIYESGGTDTRVLTDLWNKVNKETPTPGSIKPSTFATVDEMLKAAPEAKAFIDGRARQVAEQTGNRFIQAPNKSVESVTRKLNEADIMGDWNRINDVARDTIVLDNPNSLSAVIESVTKGLKEGEFRTKTQNPADYMGYEGTVINVRTPGGLNGEIQVTKPKMVYGKLPRAEAEALLGKAEVARIEKEVGVPPGLGHEIYEQIRTLSPTDEAKLNALKQQSIDYYAKLR